MSLGYSDFRICPVLLLAAASWAQGGQSFLGAAFATDREDRGIPLQKWSERSEHTAPTPNPQSPTPKVTDYSIRRRRWPSYCLLRLLEGDAGFRAVPPSSAVAEMRALRARVKPDPEGWTARDYVRYGRR